MTTVHGNRPVTQSGDIKNGPHNESRLGYGADVRSSLLCSADRSARTLHGQVTPGGLGERC